MFARQFAKPSGLFGKIAGWLMARIDTDDRWVVDLLDLRPDDRVLDVGCGPGVTLELMLARIPNGFAAGLDPSEVMLRQAAQRNEQALRSGRLELAAGEAEHLPFPDVHFSKACSLHTVFFWRSVERGLAELTRVLQPGSRLVLVAWTRRSDVPWFSPSRRGLTDEQVTELEKAVAACFTDVSLQRKDIGRESVVAVLARR